MLSMADSSKSQSVFHEIRERCSWIDNSGLQHFIIEFLNSLSLQECNSLRAGADPQRVVGQRQCELKDAHARARVYHHPSCMAIMSVVFRQADLPALSPDPSTYVYPAAEPAH